MCCCLPSGLATCSTHTGSSCMTAARMLVLVLSEVSRRSAGLLTPGVLMSLVTSNPACAAPRILGRQGQAEACASKWLTVAGADLRLEPLRFEAEDLDIRPRISLRIHHQEKERSTPICAARLGFIAAAGRCSFSRPRSFLIAQGSHLVLHFLTPYMGATTWHIAAVAGR